MERRKVEDEWRSGKMWVENYLYELQTRKQSNYFSKYNENSVACGCIFQNVLSSRQSVSIRRNCPLAIHVGYLIFAYFFTSSRSRFSCMITLYSTFTRVILCLAIVIPEYVITSRQSMQQDICFWFATVRPQYSHEFITYTKTSIAKRKIAHSSLF